MKKTSLLFILCINLLQGFSQLNSHVDERFELVSIAFRLAEAKEYVNNNVKDYVKDIDAYFEPYKKHPLIQYVKEIRERDEVAYDAVSGITFQLEIKANQVGLHPKTDKKAFLESEPRWKEDTMDKFIRLLDKFYKETKFKTFFNRHQNLYRETEKRFDEMLKTIHFEWFQSFFGDPLGNPAVYVSLCNGPSNYALNEYRKDGLSNYGIIIGCPRVDEEGIPNFIQRYNRYNNPVYYESIIKVIIHEFSHHFNNPLVEKYEQEMIASAEKMFPYVRERLANYAYGDAKAILYEGLNELFTNMYFRENNIPNVYNIRYNEDRGFVWMRRAIRFMNNFYENRILYPDIKKFIPQLVSFINTSGNQIEQIMDEYTHSFPYIVNVFPGINSSVSADVKEIRVEFSHPMMHGAYGIGVVKQDFVKMPKMKKGYYSEDGTLIILEDDENYKGAVSVCYWSDEKTLIIPVELEKGGNYGLLLPRIYQSSETFAMKEAFEILFNTK